MQTKDDVTFSSFIISVQNFDMLLVHVYIKHGAKFAQYVNDLAVSLPKSLPICSQNFSYMRPLDR